MATQTPSKTKKASANGTRKVPQKASSSKKPESEQASGLRELMEDSLKDIYWAEKALVKAIPKMIKKATSENLIEGLTNHLEETKGQVTRLEQVFEMLGKKAQAKKCDAMEGLTKEAESIMEETEEGVVRDAGIIAAAQKVEHYEIATYGTLCTFAKVLGENEVADLLHQSLEEEKKADETLTEAANNDINLEAAEEEEDEEA